MDITWYGMNCFRLAERGQQTVVTDPFSEGFGLEVPKFKADIVTISKESPEVNNLEAVKGYTYVVSGPGEYEVGGVFLYSIAMHTVDEATGAPVYNVATSINYGGLTVAHLGSLNHVPDQSVIDDLGDVNIVIVPVGGGQSLSAGKAAEVIALIEPSIIIPMQYAIPGLSLLLDPVDKFLKAMGVSKVTQEDSLRVSLSNLPEQPQVVLLNPQVS